MQHRENDGVALGPRLEELLSLQQRYFSELESLGRTQSTLVEEERTTELLDLLGRRQRLIEGIAEINALLEPFRSRWDDVMRGLPPDMQDRVRRRVDALAGAAARIAERDEADRRNLERRRDAVAHELARLDRNRGALAAYGNTPAPGARFQDREA